MVEILKELIPVCISGIKAGQSIAIWYLVVIQGIELLKFILGWSFVLVILKGAYSLLSIGLKNENNSK